MIIRTNRLETISDGVIAIAITIMILSLKLPDLTKVLTSSETISHLIHLLPYFITYAFSFMMIAIFWTNHHIMFHFLSNTDHNLVWQNFIFLFFLSLIPFATSVVGANPFIAISPVIYGSVMLLTTLSFMLMLIYSYRKHLIHKDSNRELVFNIKKASRNAIKRAFIGSVVYLVAIPLAYFNIYLSYFCFLIPPILFFIPKGIDDEELAERVAEKNLT